MINPDILDYNENQPDSDKEIFTLLSKLIDSGLNDAENKIWHANPVWFLDGNPIVGYSKQKKGIRLMFWSGKSFDEEQLNVEGEKFQDASIFYNSVSEIDQNDVQRWLKKSEEIQWDYKNIVKRKGELIKIKG
ncbi:leucyl-tRNA synthetase [Chryseobacterium formosense]|uniref:Leucyl-tRNA synthetase n=1 Tax=Chryseobacterium formosense TaxID=236814 RepID=A0A085Z7Q4_9FLAO|nr:DUF1801 domain-containing protein [Chryseobacterium formosense]KFF00468.1 leucyl-tRNA synthetase [Chryseobacterium formosense]SFT34132.1 protein of unknown function (DU1801) [Chryseobacterium formosense]